MFNKVVEPKKDKVKILNLLGLHNEKCDGLHRSHSTLGFIHSVVCLTTIP
jgi:hypothetical protein